LAVTCLTILFFVDQTLVGSESMVNATAAFELTYALPSVDVSRRIERCRAAACRVISSTSGYDDSHVSERMAGAAGDGSFHKQPSRVEGVVELLQGT
jgi:hypothetical protein